MEVYYYGQWGTVCDDRWDLNDAQVVCRELGYSKPTTVMLRSFYGQRSGRIWLDDMNCVGTEDTITNCSRNWWISNICFHEKDPSVRCSSGNFTTYYN